MANRKPPVKWIALLSTALIFLLLSPVSNFLQKWSQKPRTVIFKLPLPREVEKRFNLKSAALSIVKVQLDLQPFQDRLNRGAEILLKESGKNVWKTTAVFPPGLNHYRFQVWTTNLPGKPILSTDPANPRIVRDESGEFFSVFWNPDMSGLFFVLRVLLLVLFSVTLLIILLEPVFNRMLMMRMPFRYKMTLSIVTLGIVVNLFFIVYNIFEARIMSRQSVGETAVFIRHYLQELNIPASDFSSPEALRVTGDALRKLLWNSREGKYSDLSSFKGNRIAGVVFFSPDYHPIAWFSQQSNQDMPNAIGRVWGTDQSSYYREILFGTAILKAANTAVRPETVFALPAWRFLYSFDHPLESMIIGYRTALTPVIDGNGDVTGWIGLHFNPSLNGADILRVIGMNLLLIPFLVLLGSILLLAMGRKITESLSRLDEWTRQIVEGDYSTDRKIDTGDEISVLFQNFDRMRLTLGARIYGMELIMQATSQFQKMVQQGELIQLLTMLIALPPGFGMGRAVFFVRDGFYLKGRYAAGFDTVADMDDTLRNLTGGLRQLFEEMREWRNRLLNSYRRRMETVMADSSDHTVLWTCLNQRRPMLVQHDTYPFSMKDREIWNKAGILDALVFPVMLNREPFGVLLLDNALTGKPFREDSIREFRLLLNFFEVNLQNAHFVEQLEDTVRDRTKELEGERNQLRERYQVMESELKMARRIQQKLIPSQSPRRHIADTYIPMQVIGGDFYDYLMYRNSDRLGIFVSDVSGHGVPAALITSMLKSFLLQGGPIRERPADMLMHLNQMIAGQTDGNFVTAFYGIFDPSDRSFVWANAGHNPPYIIRGDRIEKLTTEGSGMPLAVVDNMELYRLEKNYRENTIVLEEGSKMLLYTDGLVETVNMYDRSADFETRELEKVLLALSPLGPRELVDGLIDRLRRFRGADEFEDDICVICLDSYNSSESK